MCLLLYLACFRRVLSARFKHSRRRQNVLQKCHNQFDLNALVPPTAFESKSHPRDRELVDQNLDGGGASQKRRLVLLRVLAVVIAVIGLEVQLHAVVCQNDTKVIAYKLANCTGNSEVFDTVDEMLRSIDKGNDWKSFKMDAYTEAGTPPLSCGSGDCAELTPFTISELRVLNDDMEEMVVTGVRLSTAGVASISASDIRFSELRGKIPMALFNKLLADFNEAVQEFKDNLKECFFGHFPEFIGYDSEAEATLEIEFLGGALGRYSHNTDTISLDLDAISGLANRKQADLYTLTQNVLHHEYEHHRTRDNYWYTENEVRIGRLWANSERNTQEITHHRWWHVHKTPPPQYYTKKAPFEAVLSRLITEVREDLGDDASDFSDDRIQAKYWKDLRASMSQGDESVLLGTPWNEEYYVDEKHALDACQQLQPDD